MSDAMSTAVHPNCGCCGQAVAVTTIYWTVGGIAYHPSCYPKAGCKVCKELRERTEKAEQERDAALRLLAEARPHVGWIRQGFAAEVLSIRERIDALSPSAPQEREPT